MHFDPQLWASTKGFRGRIAWVMAIGFLSLGMGIARFVVLGWLIARIFEGEQLMDLAPAAGLLLLIILARAALESWRARIAHRTAARIQDRLRLQIYDQIVRLGPAWLANQRTGSVALSSIDGVEQLQTFFGQFLPQLAIALLAPVLLFAVLSFWDVPVAAVIAAAAVLALVLPVALKRMGNESTQRRVRSFKEFGEDLLDAMQGLPTLKAFGQGEAFGERLAKKAHALAESTLFVVQTSLMSRALTDLAIAGGAAAAIALGAWRVSQGAMTLEALLIVLMAGTEVFRPLRDLRSLLHRGLTANAAAVSIKDLLRSEPDRPVRETAATPVLAPSIGFENVTFSYDESRGNALRDVSFDVRPGERIGIVGYSGSGKSTIAKLLLRLADAGGGTIRIGGEDVTAVSADHIREQIAVVQQDAYLFYGTVEDNIRLADPGAGTAEIEAAARAANAHRFICDLPDGYQTLIGERGLKLSGGQRQRIAIARAILKDAPILILDEALSSVDAENEQAIQSELDKLAVGRTTIVLAHRLSSVIDADRILVMRDGTIVDAGTHLEMVDREGPYRELMAEQFESGESGLRLDYSAAVEAEETAPRTVSGRPPQVETTEGERIAEAMAPFETLKVLFGLIAPWRRQLVLTIGSGVCRVYALIGVSTLSALVIAAIKEDEAFGSLLTAMAFLVPVAALCQWNESWRSHDMAYRLLARMRVDLYRSLERLAPAYLLRRRTGDLVSLGTQDVETIEYFFAHVVAPAVVAFLVPVTVIVALLLISWPAAVVLLPFLLYAALSPVFRRSRIDRLGAKARSGLGDLNAFVVDTVQGLAELIAFNAAAERRESFVSQIGNYQKTRVALLRDLTSQTAQQEAISALGSACVVIAGALLVDARGFDAGLIPLTALLATAAFVPVSELAQAARQLADSIASTRRVHAVHVEPVPVRDGPETLADTRRYGLSVSFNNVYFSYSGTGRQVLSDIDFAIPAGGKVALVGSSGAGKTTIANLLLRFWDPDEGSIRLGDTDLRRLRLDDLRNHIALVSQDTYLFNATLAENIRLSRPDASEDDLRRAIDRAALGPFMKSLPKGVETNVGERGTQLSGGQRQRVAIARAFLKNAPILILDEATSHLDAQSERQVRAALDHLMADRTTIVIAHQLSTIRAADLILVMDGGRIVERGTHSELIAAGGFYARLIGHQSFAFAGAG